MNAPTQSFDNVLVVDDDPAFLQLVTRCLEVGGYKVRAASDPIQALRLVEQQTPSYLITDWEMPGMDGLELCRRIRQLELPHYVYVMFLTCRGQQRDLITAMEAGADDFLSKPLRKEELLARLIAGERVLQLESRLSRMVTLDSLTELLTRRAFAAHLEKEWHRSRRYATPISVAMIDIDFFKEINDSYGHPAGDEVIRSVAELLRKTIRKSDVACRFGGEEFCVLLPDTNDESAALWSEKFRKQLTDLTIPIGPRGVHVTVSTGVAEISAEMQSADELVSSADSCLLMAKQQGRNRVITLSTLLSESSIEAKCAASAGRMSKASARDAMIPLCHHLKADWSVAQGAAYFLQFRVSSAVVTDDAGSLLGILSEKDVLGVANSDRAQDRCLHDIMRTNVVTYDESTPLEKILRFMTRAMMRSVVIQLDGKPCGLITRASLVRWLLNNHWMTTDSEPPARDCVGPISAESKSILSQLGEQLVTQSGELCKSLKELRLGHDVDAVVSGATRLQLLTEEVLAASGTCVGGGLPF